MIDETSKQFAQTLSPLIFSLDLARPAINKSIGQLAPQYQCTYAVVRDLVDQVKAAWQKHARCFGGSK